MASKGIHTGIVAVVALAAGLLAENGLHRAEAQPMAVATQRAGGDRGVVRWEYRFLDPNSVIEPTQLGVWSRGSGITDPAFSKAVNALGDQGFELFLIDKHGLYFRRQKE